MSKNYKYDFIGRVFFLLKEIEQADKDLTTHLVEEIEQNVIYMKQELNRTGNKKPSKEG